ncbi:MAG: hypothetical protein NXI18_02120 [Alphaproteobacteria bacterium]|nr:hypothetical protein [Alphaproteobacteria bacterium]
MRMFAGRTLIVGACLLALTGCITARNTIQFTDSEGRRAYLRYAGADGPVYLRAANPPASLGDHGAVGAALAEAASGAIFALPTTFTANIGAAPNPNFRIIALFDAEESLSTADLCESEAKSTGLTAARYADRSNLFLAFCTQGQALAGTKVSGPKITALSDPSLREMIRTGLREMFSQDDRQRERGEPPVLGTISGNPSSFGFRLNPLEGLVN